MTIKIALKSSEIPIEIGELDYSFRMDDESIEKFKKAIVEVEEFLKVEAAKLEKLEENDVDQLEQQKKILRISFDKILGDGAFDEIYKQTPSIINCANYFVQLGAGLKEEIDNYNGDDLSKYLEKPKAKRKK